MLIDKDHPKLPRNIRRSPNLIEMTLFLLLSSKRIETLSRSLVLTTIPAEIFHGKEAGIGKQHNLGAMCGQTAEI